VPSAQQTETKVAAQQRSRVPQSKWIQSDMNINLNMNLNRNTNTNKNMEMNMHSNRDMNLI
jgi:hypothetical protein